MNIFYKFCFFIYLIVLFSLILFFLFFFTISIISNFVLVFNIIKNKLKFLFFIILILSNIFLATKILHLLPSILACNIFLLMFISNNTPVYSVRLFNLFLLNFFTNVGLIFFTLNSTSKYLNIIIILIILFKIGIVPASSLLYNIFCNLLFKNFLLLKVLSKIFYTCLIIALIFLQKNKIDMSYFYGLEGTFFITLITVTIDATLLYSFFLATTFINFRQFMANYSLHNGAIIAILILLTIIYSHSRFETMIFVYIFEFLFSIILQNYFLLLLNKYNISSFELINYIYNNKIKFILFFVNYLALPLSCNFWIKIYITYKLMELQLPLVAFLFLLTEVVAGTVYLTKILNLITFNKPVKRL